MSVSMVVTNDHRSNFRPQGRRTSWTKPQASFPHRTGSCSSPNNTKLEMVVASIHPSPVIFFISIGFVLTRHFGGTLPPILEPSSGGVWPVLWLLPLSCTTPSHAVCVPLTQRAPHTYFTDVTWWFVWRIILFFLCSRNHSCHSSCCCCGCKKQSVRQHVCQLVLQTCATCEQPILLDLAGTWIALVYKHFTC